MFFKKRLEATWPVPRPRSPRKQGALRATVGVDWAHLIWAAFMGGSRILSGRNPWGQATEFGVSEGIRELCESVSRGGAGSTLGLCREGSRGDRPGRRLGDALGGLDGRGQGRESQGRRMGPESDRLARRGQDGARGLICDAVDGGATPDTDPRGGGRRD